MAVSSAHGRQRYEFNPACGCEICLKGGVVPRDDPSFGHSFAYGEPHLPPSAGRYPVASSVVAGSAWISRHVTLGRDCRIAEGAVIGSEGFGYIRDGDGRWAPKPESFGVVVGDDVHIGANTCIDRGSYRDTVISRGARIDNLVHIAHNVEIGEDCVIVAKAEVSGSCVIGAGAWIGPSACIKEHVTVGARALVGIGAVVIADVPENVTVAGNPARVINAEVGVREEM